MFFRRRSSSRLGHHHSPEQEEGRATYQAVALTQSSSSSTSLRMTDHSAPDGSTTPLLSSRNDGGDHDGEEGRRPPTDVDGGDDDDETNRMLGGGSGGAALVSSDSYWRYFWRQLARPYCHEGERATSGGPEDSWISTWWWVLLPVLILGILLGLVLPVQSSLQHLPYPSSSSSSQWGRFWFDYGYAYFSNIIGYTYWSAWSVSFYPQVWLNARRRTTQGLSLDFAALNALGFLCYAMYNVGLYFSPTLHREYQQQRYQAHDHNHHDHDSSPESIIIPVAPNDVAFAVHASVLSMITLLQIGYYDGGLLCGASVTTNTSAPRPSPLIQILLGIFLLTAVGALVLAAILDSAAPSSSTSSSSTAWWSWLDAIYLLSYIKIMITLIKYIPQAWFNYRRQSTAGWSMTNILLDATGGLLSYSQWMLDAWMQSDWTALSGNPAKASLGLVSLAFDIVFVLQHYIWYPPPTTLPPGPLDPGPPSATPLLLLLPMTESSPSRGPPEDLAWPPPLDDPAGP